MNKHTPGPWHAFWNENFWQINVDSDDFEHMCIGDVCESSEIFDKDHKPHDHAEANARLIAAAPCLLEALETLKDAFIVAVGATSPYAVHALERPIAAIARARGES